MCREVEREGEKGRGRGREGRSREVGQLKAHARVKPLRRFSKLLHLTISGQLAVNIPSSSDT